MPLDNSTATPLYVQIEEEMRENIESGELVAGEQLPTENELCKRYAVSRVTVRKALEKLEKRGYLVRKPGKGTFVSEKKMQRELSGVLGFSEMCRIQGFKPGAKTIRLQLENPCGEDTDKLGLTVNDRVLAVDRIRYADGRPVSLEKNLFPESFLFLLQEDLNDASLYEILGKKHDIHFTKSSKVLEIVFANYEEAAYLDIPRGYPLLLIDSVVADTLDRYRCISRQLMIADRCKMII